MAGIDRAEGGGSTALLGVDFDEVGIYIYRSGLGAVNVLVECGWAWRSWSWASAC